MQPVDHFLIVIIDLRIMKYDIGQVSLF